MEDGLCCAACLAGVKAGASWFTIGIASVHQRQWAMQVLHHYATFTRSTQIILCITEYLNLSLSITPTHQSLGKLLTT